MNLGSAEFHGVECEGKYYFHSNLLVMGSALYQTNRDGAGNGNVTPVANFASKAGVSYESPHAFTVSLFDVYQGPLHGYPSAINPAPGAYHLLNSHLRYDLSRRLRASAKTGLAVVVHGDNLANQAVWLPGWGGASGDSVFSNRGRTIYFGLEVVMRKD